MKLTTKEIADRASKFGALARKFESWSPGCYLSAEYDVRSTLAWYYVLRAKRGCRV